MSIDEIKSRLDAATPGPWKANDDGTIDGPEYAEVIYRGPVDCMSNCYGGTSVIEGDNLKPDAEFIAHAPTDVARLLAAVEGVTALHVPVTVYELDPINGSWVYDADTDERRIMTVLCSECTPDHIIEEIDDSEYDGPNDIDVNYPCPTVKAITSALEAS